MHGKNLHMLCGKLKIPVVLNTLASMVKKIKLQCSKSRIQVFNTYAYFLTTENVYLTTIVNNYFYSTGILYRIQVCFDS